MADNTAAVNATWTTRRGFKNSHYCDKWLPFLSSEELISKRFICMHVMHMGVVLKLRLWSLRRRQSRLEISSPLCCFPCPALHWTCCHGVLDCVHSFKWLMNQVGYITSYSMGCHEVNTPHVATQHDVCTMTYKLRVVDPFLLYTYQLCMLEVRSFFLCCKSSDIPEKHCYLWTCKDSYSAFQNLTLSSSILHTAPFPPAVYTSTIWSVPDILHSSSVSPIKALW